MSFGEKLVKEYGDADELTGVGIKGVGVDVAFWWGKKIRSDEVKEKQEATVIRWTWEML